MNRGTESMFFFAMMFIFIIISISWVIFRLRRNESFWYPIVSKDVHNQRMAYRKSIGIDEPLPDDVYREIAGLSWDTEPSPIFKY